MPVIGGPDFVKLPRLWLAECFRVRFDAPEGVDWTGYDFRLDLDPPTGDRLTFLTADAETILTDNAGRTVGLIFADPDTAGWETGEAHCGVAWEYHFYVTPPGGQLDHVATGTFDVVAQRKGSPQ